MLATAPEVVATAADPTLGRATTVDRADTCRATAQPSLTADTADRAEEEA